MISNARSDGLAGSLPMSQRSTRLLPSEPILAGNPLTELATNVLSYGDDLDILRRYLPDAPTND